MICVWLCVEQILWLFEVTGHFHLRLPRCPHDILLDWSRNPTLVPLAMLQFTGGFSGKYAVWAGDQLTSPGIAVRLNGSQKQGSLFIYFFFSWVVAHRHVPCLTQEGDSKAIFSSWPSGFSSSCCRTTCPPQRTNLCNAPRWATTHQVPSILFTEAHCSSCSYDTAFDYKWCGVNLVTKSSLLTWVASF